MLNTYLAQVQRLLQNPQAASQLYAVSDLTAYINMARMQLAGETECVRIMAGLTLAAGTRAYPFSLISGLPTGVAGVYNVRQALVGIGDGFRWMRPRSFEWFTLYKLNSIVVAQDIPTEWSQFAQGVLGSLYFDPIPSSGFVMSLDTACEPAALANDADPEVIPYPFTDAVQFFAAHLAYLSAQRGDDADRMMKRYEEWKDRARKTSTASVQPYIYAQSGDPTAPNKLALQQGGGAQ